MLTQDCRSIVITFSFNSVFCQLASVDKYFDLAITFALSISKNKTNVIKCKNKRKLAQWYSDWIQMKIKWFVLFPILSKIRIWPYNTLQCIKSFQERHFWIIIHLWKGSLIIIVFLLFPISFLPLKLFFSFFPLEQILLQISVSLLIGCEMSWKNTFLIYRSNDDTFFKYFKVVNCQI